MIISQILQVTNGLTNIHITLAPLGHTRVHPQASWHHRPRYDEPLEPL